jgi:hypothetical protein
MTEKNVSKGLAIVFRILIMIIRISFQMALILTLKMRFGILLRVFNSPIFTKINRPKGKQLKEITL